MVRVGLVGCGTIGSRVALALEQDYRDRAVIACLHDRDVAQAVRLHQRLASRPPVVSLTRLIRMCHLVVEAASVEIAGEVAARALGAHRSVMVMSVGGLLSDPRWARLIRRSRGRLYIPSGALAGLDGVAALAVGRIRRATLTSRKPPRALAASPLVRRRGWRLMTLRRPRVLLSGSARRMVAAFPQNANVAATLALAARRGRPGSRGAGPPLRVRIVADPTIRRNVHELEVEGDCGRVVCRVESDPSPNPRTSEQAVRSAIAALGRLLEPVVIGT
jgi:aspartate dehydrogenase